MVTLTSQYQFGIFLIIFGVLFLIMKNYTIYNVSNQTILGKFNRDVLWFGKDFALKYYRSKYYLFFNLFLIVLGIILIFLSRNNVLIANKTTFWIPLILLAFGYLYYISKKLKKTPKKR